MDILAKALRDARQAAVNRNDLELRAGLAALTTEMAVRLEAGGFQNKGVRFERESSPNRRQSLWPPIR
mgnify:CR=1 FL=1